MGWNLNEFSDIMKQVNEKEMKSKKFYLLMSGVKILMSKNKNLWRKFFLCNGKVEWEMEIGVEKFCYWESRRSFRKHVGWHVFLPWYQHFFLDFGDVVLCSNGTWLKIATPGGSEASVESDFTSFLNAVSLGLVT